MSESIHEGNIDSVVCFVGAMIAAGDVEAAVQLAMDASAEYLEEGVRYASEDESV